MGFPSNVLNLVFLSNNITPLSKLCNNTSQQILKVYNQNISHHLLVKPKSHDPLVVHLSHLLQHSKTFYKLQKMFKMLGFCCNPLNQHKNYMWRNVLWAIVANILHTIYTSRTLRNLDNICSSTCCQMENFLNHLGYKNIVQNGAITIIHTITSVMFAWFLHVLKS
jgi:hypothetical protein